MPLFWFLTGALSTLATVVLLYPWLRNISRLHTFLRHRATLPLTAVLLIVGMLVSYLEMRKPSAAVSPAAADRGALAFSSAAKTFADATGESSDSVNTAPRAASSMQSAVASLEDRLVKGGGSADDWELLAKSFEFMGRPADAAAARAHQLPKLAAGAATGTASGTESVGSGPSVGEGTTISGEVTIAAALSAKATAGDTLFIIAKSINSPGPPVAVFRGAVSAWPVKFTLSDSQSMLPGRNLSSAGRVIVEARISLKGQPLPASGDLQGATGAIDPKEKRPLKILIDDVVP